MSDYKISPVAKFLLKCHDIWDEYKIRICIITYLFIGLEIGCYDYQSCVETWSPRNGPLGIPCFFIGLFWPIVYGLWIIIKIGLWTMSWAR